MWVSRLLIVVPVMAISRSCCRLFTFLIDAHVNVLAQLAKSSGCMWCWLTYDTGIVLMGVNHDQYEPWQLFHSWCSILSGYRFEEIAHVPVGIDLYLKWLEVVASWASLMTMTWLWSGVGRSICRSCYCFAARIRGHWVSCCSTLKYWYILYLSLRW